MYDETPDVGEPRAQHRLLPHLRLTPSIDCLVIVGAFWWGDLHVRNMSAVRERAAKPICYFFPTEAPSW